MATMKLRTFITVMAAAPALAFLVHSLAVAPEANAQPRATTTTAPSSLSDVTVPASSERALKAVKSYTPADKARALQAAGVRVLTPVTTPPVILSIRRPMHPTGAWLDLYFPAIVSGKSDTVWFKSKASYAKLSFRAEANRHYLVDCQVETRPNEGLKMIVENNGKNYVSTIVTPVAGHTTTVIPKLAAAEDLSIVIQQTKSGTSFSWGMTACEITPA